MAIGDLIGDLATAYLTPAQRAAQAAKGVQSITGGPIARATDQLPKVAGLAAAVPAVAGQTSTDPAATAPQGLASAFSNPAQFAAPPQMTAPQNLASLSPTVPAQASNTPSFPAAQQPASLADLSPAAPTVTSSPVQPQQPVSLDQAYRATGVGTGSSAIVGKMGVNGVPQFSNQPPDLASAAGAAPVSNGPQMPSSLADLSPGGNSANPTAPLSTLGSASSLGDGVGTFSQAQPGDGQLAMTRFQRAADLRDGYKAQDQLQADQAAQTRDRNFTVVRDSTQPVTRREQQFDAERAQTSQSLADAVNGSQAGIAGQRQAVAADQQQRQSNRLEDALVLASSPSATPEQKQAYQNLKDPTGAAAVDRQIKQTQLANAQTDGQLKQQEFAQKAQAQQQAAQDRVKGQEGQVATFDQALGSIDSLLGTKINPKDPNGPRLDEDPGLTKTLGPIDALIPNAPGTQGADFEARLDTLKAQTFLPQIAALRGTGALSDAEGKKLSESVGALSTKMSEGAFRKSLGEVRSTLQSAKERSTKAGTPGGVQSPAGSTSPAPSPATAPQTIPTITSKAQADALPAGSIFIGPDGKQYRK